MNVAPAQISVNKRPIIIPRASWPADLRNSPMSMHSAPKTASTAKPETVMAPAMYSASLSAVARVPVPMSVSIAERVTALSAKA